MSNFWFYFFILAVFIVLGLAIGASNDSLVMFDFLFVKKEISLASVLVIGLLFGLVLGVYCSMFLTFKLWLQLKVAKTQFNRLKKKTTADQDISSK